MDWKPYQMTARRDLRYHSLDLWRGIACLMVVIFHSTFYIVYSGHPPTGPMRRVFTALGYGWIGVPIFFVISGYCIAAACETAQGIKPYFLRRFRRIFPPYWIALVFGALLSLASGGFLADTIAPVPNPFSMPLSQWLGGLTLTEFWRPHLGGAPTKMLLQQGWTLCYEEQFYAVCGLLLFLQREWFSRSLVVVTGAVALVVAVNCFRPLPIDGFFWDGRWLMFAAGILVFRVAQFGFNRRLAFALLGLFFALAAIWFVKERANMAQEMMFSFGFAASLITLFRYDQFLSEMPSLNPLKICGTMCYSLYLIHWPVSKLISKAFYTAGLQGPWVTLLITIPACVTASVALAWVFHRAVERRFMPKVHRKLSPMSLVESGKLSITMS